MKGWRTTLLGSAALVIAAPATAQEDARSCAPADLASLAGWNRVWAAEGMDAGLSGRANSPTYPLAGLDAPWNEEGWRRVAVMLRNAGTERYKQDGWGFPMMMHSFSEVKFIVAPAETAIIGQYREIRYVYTDGRPHPPEEELWPTIWGDSIGCWEGDTLVVDTVGVKFDLQYSPLVPPFSEQARFVERIRIVSPDRLEAEMTVTDPQYLKRPWTTRYVLVPAGIDRLVHDAFEDRIVLTTNGPTIAPRSEDLFATAAPVTDVKLTTAELDRIAGRYSVEGTPIVFTFEQREDRLFFTVPPLLTFYLPLFPSAPLSFADPGGGTFNFKADASGKITGFEAVDPQGAPTKAIRMEP